MASERENAEKNVEIDDKVSKSATQRAFKLQVEFLKTVFQVVLAGFVITPFIAGTIALHIILTGIIISLTCWMVATIIELRRKEDT